MRPELLLQLFSYARQTKDWSAHVLSGCGQPQNMTLIPGLKRGKANDPRRPALGDRKTMRAFANT